MWHRPRLSGSRHPIRTLVPRTRRAIRSMPGRSPKMLRRSAIVTFATFATLIWASSSRAQTTAPSQSNAPAAQQGNAANDKWKTVKWNTAAPPESYWQTLKSAPAPKRDLSGIWDGGFLEGGVQPNGAYEY